MFKKNKGFTLIELLVVIAIIGVLSGLVLVSLGGARSKARDVARQSDIRQISAALELQYMDDGHYPIIAVDVDKRITSTGLTTTYLDPWPDDPGGGDDVCNDSKGSYCAVAAAEVGPDYCVYAALENGKFFTVSDSGISTLDNKPTVLATCKP